MTPRTAQRMARRLARRQHWTIARRQLEDLGFSDEAIKHRIRVGRLREVHRGVYAVDREDLTPEGHGMAAVLACGAGTVLSHESAAVLWGILRRWTGDIQVTVPVTRLPRHPGIKVHRRSRIGGTRRRGIPVTTPVDTLVDLATRLADEELERAVNEAVNRDLTDPESLRRKVAAMRRRPGARRLLKLLDRDTYAVTDTRLEQRFLRIVREAGLPVPAAGCRRDQLHAAAGRNPLRFTHQQIFFEEPHTIAVLAAVARRLAP
jgi:hypothetical protein